MLTAFNIFVWLAIAGVVGYAGGLLAARLGLDGSKSRLAAAVGAIALLAGALFPSPNRLDIAYHLMRTEGIAPDAPGPAAPATGPCAKAPSVAGTGSVDTVVDGSGNQIDDGGTLSSDNTFVVSGWAVRADQSGPATGVCIYLDDRPLGATVTYGGSRPDVAAAYHKANFTDTGFSITVAANTLLPGTYVVSVGAQEADGSTSLVGKRTLNVR